MSGADQARRHVKSQQPQELGDLHDPVLEGRRLLQREGGAELEGRAPEPALSHGLFIMAPWASRGTGRGPEETPPATLPGTHTSGDSPKSLPRDPGDDPRSGRTSVPCPSGSHEHRTQAGAKTQGPRGAEAQGTLRPPGFSASDSSAVWVTGGGRLRGTGLGPRAPRTSLRAAWPGGQETPGAPRAAGCGAPPRGSTGHRAWGPGLAEEAEDTPRFWAPAVVPAKHPWPWVYAQVTLQARCALLVWGLAAFSHANDINSVVGFPGQ